jgi:hypothetical protein
MTCGLTHPALALSADGHYLSNVCFRPIADVRSNRERASASARSRLAGIGFE